MKILKNIGVVLGLSLLIVVGTVGLGQIEQKQAHAQIINYTVGDLESIMQFIETEAQEIAVDQIRKIVMEKLLEKMIDKIVGGQDGGTGGGSGGGSGDGQGAFIKDYEQFLLVEAAKDTTSFIDSDFDSLFPSYIDSSVKDDVKEFFEPNAQVVPDDCVDLDSIDFENDEDPETKLIKAAQPGCNELTASLILHDRAQVMFSRIYDESKTQAIANQGFVKKDEDTNELQQSGSTYESIIQANIQGIVDVQTNNESAYSSIIGALLDQALDGLLEKEY